MADETTLEADLEQAPGWRVVDGDGNVVDSGPLTHAQAAFLMGETDDDGSDADPVDGDEESERG